MQILFSSAHFGFLRNFEGVLRELAERGHHLHLMAERKDSLGGLQLVERLCADHASVTYGWAPGGKKSPWMAFGVALRLALDYLRYLEPRYDRAPALRARAARQLSPRVARALQGLTCDLPAGRRAVRAVLRGIERTVPPYREIEEYIRTRQPDVMLVTPLLYFGSQQVDHVRAAKALGVRTVLCVGSWDHLTTKGLIHELPDRVLVWNPEQQREAAELHGVPPERVIATGAQSYDHWFGREPSCTRAEFCERVGLQPDRPTILYLCSSQFIAPGEARFVLGWIDALRASADPPLRTANVLVRPHPQNARQWQEVDLSGRDGVIVWPRAGANPVDATSKADYFDSMYHADAVVGINTSGMIEAGILGRPVLSPRAAGFADTQEGTLHFQHLKNVNGGLVVMGADMAAHLEQLSDALRQGKHSPRSAAFIRGFIRPHGLDVPATPIFVQQVEEVARSAAPALAPVGRSVLRPLLYPAAVVARLFARRGDLSWWELGREALRARPKG